MTCLQSLWPLTRKVISSSITKKRYLRTSKRNPAKRRSSPFTPWRSKARSASSTCFRRCGCSAKGFETSVLLYGPGVTLGVQRGFPKIGDEAFPGHLNFNNQLAKFMGEGGKVYACRFALQALYGHGEPSLIEGIRPINPLDVLDLILLHRRDNAFMLNTWTL